MEGQAIARVTEGMRVVDAAGTELGRVELVRMGDPAAVTTEGQRVGEPDGLVETIAETVSGPEPDLPPSLAARLERVGYIKIDGKGVFAADRYAAADQIADVSDEAVTLTVPGEQLPAAR